MKLKERDGNETDCTLSKSAKNQMHSMIVTVISKLPETYVAKGAQNVIIQLFQANVTKSNWSVADVQAKGYRAIKQFLKQDSIDDLLADTDVALSAIDPVSIVKAVVERMIAKGKPSEVSISTPQSSCAATAGISPATKSIPFTKPSTSPASASAMIKASPQAQEALLQGVMGEKEIGERLRHQEKQHAEIEQDEWGKISENMDSYVKQGLLTKQESMDFLSGSLEDGRHKYLERKIKKAVDYVVLYLEVFEALKDIPEKRDDALRFLIRYKTRVMAANGDMDVAPAIEELLEEPDLLQHILDIMKREDQEIRMISAKLPPYSRIISRNENIQNMVIEERFVDDLRALSSDGLSERLNASEPEIRIRPAADIKCLLVLLGHMTQLTRFCQEVRIHKITQTLQELYRSTQNLIKASDKVNHFMERRLTYLYPDLTHYEKATVEQYSADMLNPPKQEKPEENLTATGGTGGQESFDLTEDELRAGIQIGRVAVRVAGQQKRIPYKIMADPEDPEKHIIVQKDLETGELVVTRRRGSKRYVEKNRDGEWEMV